jgi:ankyrin repeat protein
MDLNKGWNKDLIIQRDENGSTPLHFAAGLLEEEAKKKKGLLVAPNRRESVVCSILLEANTDAMYQLDNDGLSPIHIAASVGRFLTIALFLEKCPGSACLRDAKGRTFLHVAVEKKMLCTVYYACMHPLVAWIRFRQKCMNLSQQAWVMNIQDNDGNTALHLAVKAGSLIMFSALFANRNVDLNITNAKGQTPLDIARYNVPPGLFYKQVIFFTPL